MPYDAWKCRSDAGESMVWESRLKLLFTWRGKPLFISLEAVASNESYMWWCSGVANTCSAALAPITLDLSLLRSYCQCSEAIATCSGAIANAPKPLPWLRCQCYYLNAVAIANQAVESGRWHIYTVCKTFGSGHWNVWDDELIARSTMGVSPIFIDLIDNCVELKFGDSGPARAFDRGGRSMRAEVVRLPAATTILSTQSLSFT